MKSCEKFLFFWPLENQHIFYSKYETCKNLKKDFLIWIWILNQFDCNVTLFSSISKKNYWFSRGRSFKDKYKKRNLVRFYSLLHFKQILHTFIKLWNCERKLMLSIRIFLNLLTSVFIVNVKLSKAGFSQYLLCLLESTRFQALNYVINHVVLFVTFWQKSPLYFTLNTQYLKVLSSKGVLPYKKCTNNNLQSLILYISLSLKDK